MDKNVRMYDAGVETFADSVDADLPIEAQPKKGSPTITNGQPPHIER
jgi:hypothetical protein